MSLLQSFKNFALFFYKHAAPLELRKGQDAAVSPVGAAGLKARHAGFPRFPSAFIFPSSAVEMNYSG